VGRLLRGLVRLITSSVPFHSPAGEWSRLSLASLDRAVEPGRHLVTVVLVLTTATRLA
jgi:hypothetical protein